MTISTTTNRASFAGNGTTTAFATGFKFFANSDLTVILVVDATGVETTKILDTDYTVTGAGEDSGGTVTMNTAPASGETLVIVRSQPYTQTLDLVENDPFPSESVEQAFDKLVIMTQQLKFNNDLKLGFSQTSTATATVPDPVANKLLGWNSAGTDLENKTISDAETLVTSAFIDTLLDDSSASEARTTLGAGTLSNLVEDTTPQLGGDLDLNGNVITGLPSTIYGHNGSLAPHENLVITNNSTNPAYQVDVDADVFVVTNSAGEQVRLTSVNLTADITASGANGLDTGVEATSTWYHIWVIYNGSTTSALLSTATAFGSVTLPSGYTYAGYAGAIRNTAGSDFYEIKQIDCVVASRSVTVLSSGSSTTYTTVDISGAVPSTAKVVATSLYVVNLTTANCTLRVRSGTVNSQIVGGVLNSAATTGGTAESQYIYAAFPQITAGQLEYKVDTANDDADIAVIGWEY